jgi:hypothetical protein
MVDDTLFNQDERIDLAPNEEQKDMKTGIAREEEATRAVQEGGGSRTFFYGALFSCP